MILLNTDPHLDFEFRRGDRVAQLVVQRVESVTFVAVSELGESERGNGRFGHTGR